MRSKTNRRPENDQITWGITAVVVIGISIAIYFIFEKMGIIIGALDSLFIILRPITVGLVFAYLLLPVYNAFAGVITPFLEKKMKKKEHAKSAGRLLSTMISVLLAAAVIIALFSLILPQVFSSVYSIVESLPSQLKNLSNNVTGLLKDYPDIETQVKTFINGFGDNLSGWLKEKLIPSMSNVLSGITIGVMGVLNFALNAVVGVIVCIYVLNSKEVFAAQGKKLTYSILNVEHSNAFIDCIRLFHKVFGGFLTGKILDSMIIGLICFVTMEILNMPYTMMISVIIGVTNIIPFFGPFIGAIPSALIILMEKPIQALYFIIMILILQQIDGNIIGPKILGDSTGLTSFWVMFSIIVGGGLFGFAGMVLGIPLFAVIYALVSAAIKIRLAKLNLPAETEEYKTIDFINSETLKPVRFNDKETEGHEMTDLFDRQIIRNSTGESDENSDVTDNGDERQQNEKNENTKE